MRINFLKITSFLFLNLILQNEAFTQIIDSSFYEWTVYELEGDEIDEKKCYIVAHPIKSNSNNPSRSKPYLMITRFQNRRIEQVSVHSGFEYKINSKVLISIDDKQFLLATNKDMAWTKNKYEDALVIQNLLDSSIMKTRADSAIGTFAIDEYSLKGIAKAYSRLKYICQ